MKEDLLYALRLTMNENTVDLGIKWILENQIEIERFCHKFDMDFNIRKNQSFTYVIFYYRLHWSDITINSERKFTCYFNLNELIKHLENVN
jgi:hypothetical protein